MSELDWHRKAAAEMSAFKATIDISISTDYNRDDDEIGLGGWASFSAKHIHLTTEVAKVTDTKEATITIVHEFCHMKLTIHEQAPTPTTINMNDIVLGEGRWTRTSRQPRAHRHSDSSSAAISAAP